MTSSLNKNANQMNDKQNRLKKQSPIAQAATALAYVLLPDDRVIVCLPNLFDRGKRSINE